MTALHAGTKRKAEEDVQHSNSKSPRLSEPQEPGGHNTDSPMQNKFITAQIAGENGDVRRPTNEAASNADPEQGSVHEASTPKADNDGDGVLKPLDGKEPPHDDQQADGEKQNIDEVTDSDFDEEEYLRARAKDRETANEFIEQMVVLVEAYRRKEMPNADPECLTKFNNHLQTVCDLVNQSDLRMTTSLDFPFGGLDDLKRLCESRERSQAKEHEYRECLDGIDSALKSRTRAILSSRIDDEKSSEEAVELERQISEADQALEAAEQRCCIVHEELRLEHEEDERKSELVLKSAENTLVKKGLLQPCRGETENGRTESEQKRPAGSTYGAADDKRYEHQHSQRTRSGGSYYQDFHTARPPREMRDVVQDEKASAVEKAEGELEHIAIQRERARRNYGRNVRQYLAANKREQVRGTKSDFDRMFFMEQIDFTAEQLEAERRLERARQHAKAAGVMQSEDLTSDFGDLSDNGYANASDHGEDLLWGLKKEEIRDWADRIDVLFVDGEPKAIGENDWSVMGDRPEPGGKPVHAFSDGIQPYLDDLLDEPERRKAIDDYRQKMDRLRATIALRELHWWEECCGI